MHDRDVDRHRCSTLGVISRRKDSYASQSRAWRLPPAMAGAGKRPRHTVSLARRGGRFFMDSRRFDSLARTVGRRRSRRSAFQALAAAALTAASVRVGLSEDPVVAAEVTTERHFGCLNVGQACNGDDSRCCSGRCEGRPAKRGKRGKNGRRRRNREDRSLCVAHDEAECTAGQDTCVDGLAIACGFRGRGACFQTTGNAGFCGRIEGAKPPALRCEVCTKDDDCVALGYGGDSACVVCQSECRFRNENATACVGSEA